MQNSTSIYGLSGDLLEKAKKIATDKGWSISKLVLYILTEYIKHKGE